MADSLPKWSLGEAEHRARHPACRWRGDSMNGEAAFGGVVNEPDNAIL